MRTGNVTLFAEIWNEYIRYMWLHNSLCPLCWSMFCTMHVTNKLNVHVVPKVCKSQIEGFNTASIPYCFKCVAFTTVSSCIDHKEKRWAGSIFTASSRTLLQIKGWIKHTKGHWKAKLKSIAMQGTYTLVTHLTCVLLFLYQVDTPLLTHHGRMLGSMCCHQCQANASLTRHHRSL